MGLVSEQKKFGTDRVDLLLPSCEIAQVRRTVKQ